MCGILGISKKQGQASIDAYDSLLMLQHRGQDAAGMVSFDRHHFYEKKGNGLVKDVFSQADIDYLRGNTALGHVRYPTAGSLDAMQAQPFFVNAPFGIYLVHNGNLTNTDILRTQIQKTYRRHLRTSSDSEILLNILADGLFRNIKNNPKRQMIDNVFAAVTSTMRTVRGAHSVIALIDQVGLLAWRDPHGIRPLSLGKKETSLGNEWMFASEDVAFFPSNFQKVRDLNPGEAMLITPAGELITRQCVKGRLNPCIFEYVYLARPDSMLDKISVYKTRLRLGQALSCRLKSIKKNIDAVMPVPDSSRTAAMEIAQCLGIKYREGLIKNRYVGRTFIMPDQHTRDQSVRRKLTPIGLEFRRRNILLVDDSIVRGTTMSQIVSMCRQAGAKKVYVASAAPPVKFPNVYGIDLPVRQELIASSLSEEEVGKALHTDGLFYQTLKNLKWAAREGNKNIKHFDASCFDGKYVTGDIDHEYLSNLESNQRARQKSESLSLFSV